MVVMVGDFVVGRCRTRLGEGRHRLLIEPLERAHAADEPARESTCSHDPSSSREGGSLAALRVHGEALLTERYTRLALELLKVGSLGLGDEGQGAAALAGTPGAADTVDVCLGILRKVEVHDVVDPLD